MRVVESLDGQDQMFRLFATAFFVGPKFLLTSGHILHAAKRLKKIWLCIPDTSFVELDEVGLKSYAIRCYRISGEKEH